MLRIQEAREARGWSQEKLANAIGTTQQTIQRWESGAVDPQISKVEAISGALGVTVSFLLGVETAAPAPDERELLSLYRRMEPDQRRMLMENARLYAAMAGWAASVPRPDGKLVTQ